MHIYIMHASYLPQSSELLQCEHKLTSQWAILRSLAYKSIRCHLFVLHVISIHLQICKLLAVISYMKFEKNRPGDFLPCKKGKKKHYIWNNFFFFHFHDRFRDFSAFMRQKNWETPQQIDWSQQWMSRCKPIQNELIFAQIEGRPVGHFK